LPKVRKRYEAAEFYKGEHESSIKVLEDDIDGLSDCESVTSVCHCTQNLTTSPPLRNLLLLLLLILLMLLLV
jgi:hypothetical protein